MNYTRFRPPHLVQEYVGQSGMEIGGQLLSPAAYQALAESKASGQPCALVVIGEYHGDGRRYLDLGVPTAYIEETTDYRWDEAARKLRLICPDCGFKDGKHRRGCEA